MFTSNRRKVRVTSAVPRSRLRVVRSLGASALTRRPGYTLILSYNSTCDERVEILLADTDRSPSNAHAKVGKLSLGTEVVDRGLRNLQYRRYLLNSSRFHCFQSLLEAAAVPSQTSDFKNPFARARKLLR